MNRSISSITGRIWRPQGKWAPIRPVGCLAKWRGVRRVAPNPSFNRYQPACKPGSVGHRPLAADDTRRPFLWDNVCTLPRATYPDDEPDIALAAFSLSRTTPRCRPYSVLLPVWFAVPDPLPDPRCALTAPFHPCPASLPFGAPPGGSFSVALSLGLPPPEVIRHRMSMEPGLSSPESLSALAGAAVRPTDPKAMGVCPVGVKVEPSAPSFKINYPENVVLRWGHSTGYRRSRRLKKEDRDAVFAVDLPE